MTDKLTPIFPAPVNMPLGLNVSVLSNTTLGISSGGCMDDSYDRNMILASNTVLNAALNGVNGLDAGSLAASTIYYVYIIQSGIDLTLPVATLLSTSSTTPVLPQDYSFKKLIGVALTDGSSHFLNLLQIGSGAVRRYYFDTPISVLSGGTQTSFTAVDFASYIPLVTTQVVLNTSFTPAVAADTATLIPDGSSSTGYVILSGVVAAKAQDGQVTMPAQVNSNAVGIEYKVTTGGSLSLLLVAFDHNIA